MPFFKNNELAQKLYFIKEAEDCYDIKLGNPEYGFPELTYRDWLANYECFELPKVKFINPGDLERLSEDYGMESGELYLIAAMEYHYDQ